jgi:hypothetical protein
MSQNGFNGVDGPLVDVELKKASARLQLTQIGHQIPQSERTMRVLGIQGGENNVRHSEGAVSHNEHLAERADSARS